MEISKRPWPILSVCGIKSKIDTNPDFQRPPVWSRAQKQLLIDTILRGYDIPKLYWRRLSVRPDKYDVIDGQQRLRAVFEFQQDGFPLPKDTEPLDGIALGGLKYSDLPDELRVNFDSYPLDVIVMSDTDEEEVREMFLRLQNGTSLKAQEKRNAKPGQMRDFVKGLAAHKFFSNCGFSNSRYTFDLVAAQMSAIELNGGPCNVKNANLNSMYEDFEDFDRNGPKARKIKRTLDYLLKAFAEKTPELERYSVITLYSMVSHCIEKYGYGYGYGVRPDYGLIALNAPLKFRARGERHLSPDIYLLTLSTFKNSQNLKTPSLPRFRNSGSVRNDLLQRRRNQDNLTTETLRTRRER